MNAFRTAYRYWAALVAAAVVVQFFFAGVGVFRVYHTADKGGVRDEDVFEDKFNLHAALGNILILAGIVLFLLALGARAGRTRVLLSLAVPVLIFVNSLLAYAGEDTAWVGAFHVLVGLGILGLTGQLAQRVWTAGRPEPRAPAAAPLP